MVVVPLTAAIGVRMGRDAEEVPGGPCRNVVAVKPCSGFAIQVFPFSPNLFNFTTPQVFLPYNFCGLLNCGW